MPSCPGGLPWALAVRAEPVSSCRKGQQMSMCQRRDSSSSHIPWALSGLPWNVHCDVIWSHNLEGEHCLAERGMGLSNGTNLGAGHPASIICQPSTIIWFPCLGVLAALFWEREQGAGGSQDRLRGMWCNPPLKFTAPCHCLWSHGSSYILGQGRNWVGEDGSWDNAYGCHPISHAQSCSF